MTDSKRGKHLPHAEEAYVLQYIMKRRVNNNGSKYKRQGRRDEARPGLRVGTLYYGNEGPGFKTGRCKEDGASLVRASGVCQSFVRRELWTFKRSGTEDGRSCQSSDLTMLIHSHLIGYSVTGGSLMQANPSNA